MLLFKKKQDGESAKPKVKMVKETKCTCNSCGKVWYFGKQEQIQEGARAVTTASSACLCPCLGCLSAIFGKRPKDFKQCPQCQSKNVTTEEVSYEVAK